MNFLPTAPSQAQALSASVNSQPGFSSLFAQEQYLTPDGKKLYFTVRSGSSGVTTPNIEERWVTDGTVNGTIKVGNALYSGGNYLVNRYPRTLTSIGNGDRLIYEAGEGIWTSDINGLNQTQLQGFDEIPVYKQPSRPSGAIVNQTQNGNVFFIGDELGPNSFSLWKSDGTVAGTLKLKELQPRVYSAYGPFNGYTTETVALNNNLYFTVGDGAVHNNEFWQTNALTNETRRVDFFQGKIDRLSKLNQKLFFSGKADDGRKGWWISDGSAAGTKFLGDFNLQQPYVTSGAIQDDTFYFIGTANDGRQGLWAANIDTAATQLLDSLPSSFEPGGYYSHLKIETLADRTYLWFVDGRSNKGSIWETNSTTAGTKRIIFSDATHDAAVSLSGNWVKIQNRLYFSASTIGANAANSTFSLWDLNLDSSQPWATFSGSQIDPSSIFEFNGNSYFSGTTHSAYSNTSTYSPANQLLLKLDNTTGAISIVTQTSSDSGSWQKLGDRIIFQPLSFYSNISGTDYWGSLQSTDGTTTTTLLDPRQFVLGSAPPSVPPTLLLGENLSTLSGDWDIKGTIGTDTIAHNQITGEVAYFNPSSQKTSLYTIWEQNWEIKGIADFNGDGEQDLFWQSRSSGLTVIWNLKNQAIDSSTALFRVTDPNWKVEGFADMDKDGKTDILWQHKTQGTFIYWKMDGNSIDRTIYLTSAPDLNWSVKGLADFDKNGDMDILWRNDNTGEVQLWRLAYNRVAYTVNLPTVVDRNWQIRGVADFDGDRQYDLLWSNTATKEVVVWNWAWNDAWKTDYESYVSQSDLDSGDPSKWTYKFYKSIMPKGSYLNGLNGNEIDVIGLR